MRMLPVRTRRLELRKAVFAGLLGGLAGAWAMSCFSDGWERAAELARGSETKSRRRKAPPPLMHASQQEWDSTVNTAVVVARQVLHRRLRRNQRELGAVVVHYAVGASMATGYAVLREFWPGARLAAGAFFGAALWLAAQEVAMPLLRLSGSPRQYSLPAQAQSLGEHVVYGCTTEIVLRVVQETL